MNPVLRNVLRNVLFFHCAFTNQLLEWLWLWSNFNNDYIYFHLHYTQGGVAVEQMDLTLIIIPPIGVIFKLET